MTTITDSVECPKCHDQMMRDRFSNSALQVCQCGKCGYGFETQNANGVPSPGETFGGHGVSSVVGDGCTTSWPLEGEDNRKHLAEAKRYMKSATGDIRRIVLSLKGSDGSFHQHVITA